MAELVLGHLDRLKETLGEPARDLKLNLGNVLSTDTLTPEQTWGVALASCYYLGNKVTQYLGLDNSWPGASLRASPRP